MHAGWPSNPLCLQWVCASYEEAGVSSRVERLGSSTEALVFFEGSGEVRSCAWPTLTPRLKVLLSLPSQTSLMLLRLHLR